MLKKKFRKLVNNPKLFFSDMAIKHSDKISYLKPKKMEGHYQYTVVSAVYNVGRYLDDYFESLVKQRLDFKKHIQLVLVDDGSTDNSADIIKKWQKKHPSNITYIYKENGGQASARNMGLEHVTSQWVSFIDPDDFVDLDYFLEIDNAIYSAKCNDIAYIANKVVMFDEKDRKFSSSHPMNFKFSTKSELVHRSSLRSLQLSAATGVFDYLMLKEFDVKFPEDVKPGFEDAYFVNSILPISNRERVLLSPKAKYFYRKRSSRDSTIDKTWYSKDKYTTIFDNGLNRLIDLSLSKRGELLSSIQNTIIYDVMYYIKRFLDFDSRYFELPFDWRENLYNKMRSVISRLDEERIINFRLAGFNDLHCSVLFSLSGREYISNIRVGQVDRDRKIIELFYYSVGCSNFEQVFLNRQEILPVSSKYQMHKFFGENISVTRRLYVRYKKESDFIGIKINGEIKSFILGAGHLGNELLVSNNIEHKINSISNNEIWLLMDRPDRAGDNAEHFYRYLMNNSSIDLHFSLSKSSPDWNRLLNDGFRLVDYDSKDFESVFIKSGKFLSSHNYPLLLRKHGLKIDSKKFIFLQHGVIHNDASRAVNNSVIDLFVCSSPNEYQAISSDISNYKHSKLNVALVGLARHDALVNSDSYEKDIVLIMPTWRSYLVGSFVGDGLRREKVELDVKADEFFMCWNDFLDSDAIKYATFNKGMKPVLLLHPELEVHQDKFSIPDYVNVIKFGDTSVQDIMCSSVMLITDYSSIAFDFAFMQKAVVYYQFDRESFFSNHYSQGYFDFDIDGFGPIASNKHELHVNVCTILDAGGKPRDVYRERIDSAFIYRDGRNCQRTYEAIIALDKPFPEDFVDITILLSWAKKASMFGDWPSAENHWRQVVELADPRMLITSQLQLAETLTEQGKFSEAENSLVVVSQLVADKSIDALTRQNALLAMAREKWVVAATFWTCLSDATIDDKLSQLQTMAELGEYQEVERLLAQLQTSICSEAALEVGYAWLAWSQGVYSEIIELLADPLSKFNKAQLRTWKPQLLLSRAHRMLGDFDAAQQQLASFEACACNMSSYFSEMARLAYARLDMSKVIIKIEKAYPLSIDIPHTLQEIYIDALVNTQAWQLAIKNIKQFIEAGGNHAILFETLGELYFKTSNWIEAEQCFRHISYQCNPYRLIYALRMQGKIEEAWEIIISDIKPPASFDDLILAAEVSQLSGHWCLAHGYWNELISNYSVKIKGEHIVQWGTAALMSKRSKDYYKNKDYVH
ncbi:CDP-glycerol glycerophosphotransferase family protein [Aeromonas veronii]